MKQNDEHKIREKKWNMEQVYDNYEKTKITSMGSRTFPLERKFWP